MEALHVLCRFKQFENPTRSRRDIRETPEISEKHTNYILFLGRKICMTATKSSFLNKVKMIDFLVLTFLKTQGDDQYSYTAVHCQLFTHQVRRDDQKTVHSMLRFITRVVKLLVVMIRTSGITGMPRSSLRLFIKNVILIFGAHVCAN